MAVPDIQGTNVEGVAPEKTNDCLYKQVEEGAKGQGWQLATSTRTRFLEQPQDSWNMDEVTTSCNDVAVKWCCCMRQP